MNPVEMEVQLNTNMDIYMDKICRKSSPKLGFSQQTTFVGRNMNNHGKCLTQIRLVEFL